MATDEELARPGQYKNYSEFLLHEKRHLRVGFKPRELAMRPHYRSRDATYYNFQRWLEKGRGSEGLHEVQGVTVVHLYANGITKKLFDRHPHSFEHFRNILSTVDQDINTRFIYIRPDIKHDRAVGVCDTIGTTLSLEADFLWSVFGRTAWSHLRQRGDGYIEYLWLPLLAPDLTFLRFGDRHIKLLPSFTLGRNKLNIG